MSKFAGTFAFAGLMLAGVATAAPQVTPDPGNDLAISQALKGSWREPANAARDSYRHPKETLEFFGLKPDMTVVELWPGGGWYTEILAPVLRDYGQLIAAAVPTHGAAESDTAQAYAKKL